MCSYSDQCYYQTVRVCLLYTLSLRNMYLGKCCEGNVYVCLIATAVHVRPEDARVLSGLIWSHLISRSVWQMFSSLIHDRSSETCHSRWIWIFTRIYQTEPSGPMSRSFWILRRLTDLTPFRRWQCFTVIHWHKHSQTSGSWIPFLF